MPHKPEATDQKKVECAVTNLRQIVRWLLDVSPANQVQYVVSEVLEQEREQKAGLVG